MKIHSLKYETCTTLEMIQCATITVTKNAHMRQNVSMLARAGFKNIETKQNTFFGCNHKVLNVAQPR